jgi:hypothetical protein
MNCVVCHSMDSESLAHLWQMLEICIGIFIRVARERTCLYHVDQCQLEYKVSFSHCHIWPSRDNVLEGAENLRIILSAISADEVLSTGSTVLVY